MIIDFLTELDLDFEDDLRILNTEFVQMRIIESCYALPIVELKLNFLDPDRYDRFSKSTYFDVTLTYKEKKGIQVNTEPIIFRCNVIGVKSPSISQIRTVVVKGLFFDKEFNQDRVTDTYTDMTLNEILAGVKAKSLVVSADLFSKKDTFYHFNTNWWDFTLNYLMPFIQADGSGVPLMGVTLKETKNLLRVVDTTKSAEPDYKVAPKGGQNIYEYELLTMDTMFDEQTFMMGRMHSLVKSSYNKDETLPFLSPYNQIVDMPIMFDNGNCAENHTIKPIEHTSRYLTTPTYKLSFGHSLSPIRLLDSVEVDTSEYSLSRVYYVTKVVTSITTKVERTFFMKGF